MKQYRNILTFADYGSPYKGNFISSLEVLEQQLLKKNHKMFYILPSRAKKREWAKNKKNTMFLTDNFFEDLKNVKKIVKENNIDIIHIHFYGVKILLLFKLAKLDCKIFIHLHGIFQKYKGLKKVIFKHLFKNTNIIGCSETVTKSFLFKEDVKNLICIKNAIYFPRLDEYKKVEELDVKNKVKILIFAYNYYVKGADIAIDAISKARTINDNINCYVSISSNRDIFEKNVKERFGEIPNWITVLEPRNDVASFYKNSDIFISASRREGFCYALVEAAYTGCNIIASNIPAQKENNVKGILWFEKENVEDLKDKILDCINNKEKYKKEIISQKEIIKQRYDINEWARKIVQQYEVL